VTSVGRVFDFFNTHQFWHLKFFGIKDPSIMVFKIFRNRKKNRWVVLVFDKKKFQIQRTVGSGVFQNLQRTIEFHERTEKDPPALWWLFDF
jgi:hypothetical protein